MLELYELPANQPASTQPPRNPGASTGATTSAEASTMTFVNTAGGNATYEQQVAVSNTGTDGVFHPGISCYGFHGFRRYSNECPGVTTTTTAGTTLTQYSFMLAQATDCRIDNKWLILDSQSTISVFCYPNILTNICHSDCTLLALTNGCHQDSHIIGDFPNLGVNCGTTRTLSPTSCHSPSCTSCVGSSWTNKELAMHVH